MIINSLLDILSPKKVVVYGVATDYCVKYAIEGLLRRCYDVVLVKDAIKGINETESKRLLEYWNEMEVELLTTEDVEVLINGRTEDSNTTKST
jgi:nicotinamidase-related amidase